MRDKDRAGRRFDTRRAAMLDGEGRLEELRPDGLLREVAGLSEGMVCVDIGSGTGTFSLPMSRLVGDEGIVYAVDESADMLEHIRKKQPPANLKLVHRNAERTGLASQVTDFCLLAFILHEVKQADRLVSEVSRLLKPGGKVLIVEWKADRDSPGPPRKIRLSRERLEGLLEDAGLSLIDYRDWSSNHYAATGVKKGPHKRTP
ncbi:MAG: methyltransferase domain-containing protein [Chloroflexi bacterium]|nr:methyltransferase domain-containing protein [Chloroflexota bacterium]